VTVTADNHLIAKGPPVVGKGPYGSVAVGGANADVTIAASGGAVHHGLLAVAATAKAPRVQFSSNASFGANTRTDVSSAPGGGLKPPLIGLPITLPPILGGNPQVTPPTPPDVAVLVPMPPTVVPPTPPPGNSPRNGPRNDNLLPWFNALAQWQGAGPWADLWLGSVTRTWPISLHRTAQAQPASFARHWGPRADTEVVPKATPKTRRPFPLGP